MWTCYNCKTELPPDDDNVTSLLAGGANCKNCGADNVMPRPIMEEEARRTYYNCAIWEDKKMEKFQWSDNGTGVCYECGKPFPTEGLQKRADEHEKEHPGFRRAFSQCPSHNYGDVALFERDCEYVS